MRFEASDLKDQKTSFVFRRFVLTADADIAPRLRSVFELEFERFRKLGLEKSAAPSSGALEVGQSVEATTDSEIALEQAWLQYDIYDWLRLRGGGILVPLTRNYLMLDLMNDLAFPVVLVSRTGLGAINHALRVFRRGPRDVIVDGM